MKETLKEAFALRKNLHFTEAIEIYQPLWQQDQVLFNDWDGWSFGFCLSKLNRHDEALEVCRAIFPRFKESEFIRSLYAKCIYYTQFQKHPLPAISILKKAVTAMLELSPPHDAYSFTSRAIFKLVKQLLNEQQINWREIEEWLMRMEPDLLDDRPFQMTDSNGKKLELASPMEEWYAHMIKLKGGLNQPEELLKLIDTAKRKNLKWHYNNDIWFARKEAFAYQQLNETKKSEAILRKIVSLKKDWFLLFDLAIVVDDPTESLQLCCRAALSPGKNEHKLKLYHHIYMKIKEHEQYQKEAGWHLCMIAAVREENGWDVKPELIEEIQRRRIDQNAMGSSSKIYKALSPFWQQMSGHSNPTKLKGVIEKILPNNKSGFIKCTDHNRYFFNLKGIKSNAEVGTKVIFELCDGFDYKKNVPSKIAVNVTEDVQGC